VSSAHANRNTMMRIAASSHHHDLSTAGYGSAPAVALGATVSIVPEVPQRELRNDNADIIRRVEAGEVFTVTRNGVPVAELRPLPPGRSRIVPRHRLAEMAARVDRIDRAALRAELDDVTDPWVQP
jgi:prevent-host-death family protein